MTYLTFLLVLIGWIFSLCLHEFSHALVAYYGGDTTVRDKGYLTFNPLKYTHPVYSLLMPLIFLALGGIGLPGGAVYIESWRIRDRRWLSAVSLAGPFANFIVAVILGILLHYTSLAQSSIGPALAFLAYLQVTAVVLNLIPLPPLDGFGIIAPYLNPDLRQNIARIGGSAILIVFFVIWYVPFISNLFSTITLTLSMILGVPLPLASLGYSQFFFWKKF
jgi:Zn-dependent protease